MDDDLNILDTRPSRTDAVRNRAHILETARMLFDEQGIDEVPMSAIAEAAGVGKGTLYRNFRNKAELCNALLDHEQQQLQERALRRLRLMDDPLDNLRWFLIEVAEFARINAPLLCQGTHESGFTSLNHPAHLWWRQTIRGLLARLHLAGDIDYMTDVLYVMLDAHTIYFQETALGYDKTRIHDGLISTLLSFLQ